MIHVGFAVAGLRTGSLQHPVNGGPRDGVEALSHLEGFLSVPSPLGHGFRPSPLALLELGLAGGDRDRRPLTSKETLYRSSIGSAHQNGSRVSGQSGTQGVELGPPGGIVLSLQDVDQKRNRLRESQLSDQVPRLLEEVAAAFEVDANNRTPAELRDANCDRFSSALARADNDQGIRVTKALAEFIETRLGALRNEQLALDREGLESGGLWELLALQEPLQEPWSHRDSAAAEGLDAFVGIEQQQAVLNQRRTAHESAGQGEPLRSGSSENP